MDAVYSSGDAATAGFLVEATFVDVVFLELVGDTQAAVHSTRSD